VYNIFTLLHFAILRSSKSRILQDWTAEFFEGILGKVSYPVILVAVPVNHHEKWEGYSGRRYSMGCLHSGKQRARLRNRAAPTSFGGRKEGAPPDRCSSPAGLGT